MINCLLAGVGGQGTVLASKIIALTKINSGVAVRSAETIGMAQRGGSVFSHVRIGEGSFSPLIPFGKADIIIGFEPAEAVRCLSYLKENGTVVVSKKAIAPVTASLSQNVYDGKEMIEYLRKNVKNLIVIDGEKICEECKSSKVLNMALLGAALSTDVLQIKKEDVTAAIKSAVKEKFIDINILALEKGRQAGKMR